MVVPMPRNRQTTPARRRVSGTPGRENFYTTRGKAHPRTVLIVDDEWLIRWALAETLRDDGSRVSLAATGAEALAYFRRGGAADVIVGDPVFPDVAELDLDLIGRLRAGAPDARIVVLTAGIASEASDAARRYGADDVLDKPFDLATLARAVRGPEASVP